MYLKQITINGFKSFADKTEVDLPKGITCIVGPNGCGKSNIVDAIRWVLGEQSAKALRGGKMQDVIFEGTEKRKALQLCDVRLLFSECERELGTNFNEVEIARRVSRDGGSDYFINGKTSRLKDVQNLFMDTGIGRVSYSFMVQGQIDQILSSNPSERRAIFEEAAGITKYKAQRREALNKLALVDQNLARISDRIEEINRQIGTLKRQASKALRYKRLSHRLKHLDLAWNAKIYSEQSLVINENQTKLAELTTSFDSLSTGILQKEAKLNVLRSQRYEINEELERMRAKAAQLRSDKEQAARDAEFSQVRKRDLNERLARINSEINSLNEQLSNLTGKANDDVQTKEQHLALVLDSDQIFKKQNDELNALEIALRENETDLSALRQDMLVHEGSITRLRSSCTTLEVDLKSYQVRHAACADIIFALKEELTTLNNKFQEYTAAAENNITRISQAQEDIVVSQNKQAETIASYRDKQGQIQIADRQLASKNARLSLLKDFQARLEGYSDGVKAIMQGKVSDIIAPAQAKIITQNTEVQEGWINSFEAMLSQGVDALCLEDNSKISELVKALNERSLGKACIKLDDFNKFSVYQNLPANIYPANTIVSCISEDSKLRELTDKLVAGCYFCEDIFEFVKFALEHKDFNFALASDKNCNVIDCRGVIYSASASAKSTDSPFVMRSKEIRRLESEIVTDNEALTKLNEEALSIQSTLNDIEAEIEEKRQVASEIKREMASLEAQTSSLQNTVKSKNFDLEKQNALLAEMENSRFEAQDKLNKAVELLQEAENKIESFRQQISQKEAQIVEFRKSKEEKFNLMSEARLDLATKKQRLENLEKGLSAIKEQENETLSQIQNRRIELESIQSSVESLDTNFANNSKLSEELATQLKEAIKLLEEKKSELQVCEETFSQSDKLLQEERQVLQKKSLEKNEVEVTLAKLQSHRDFSVDRIKQEYEMDISLVDFKMELWNADEEFQTSLNLADLEEGEADTVVKRKDRGEPTKEKLDELDSTNFDLIEEEIKELRAKISAIGAVNLVAIEEYAELKERYDFLKTQSDDLWSSKNELVTAIDEINETSQKLFSETFEQIRKNFEFTFKKLFGGGTADLNLVQNEDVLDGGIDIIARPPGTMLKSLSLLSGGQRTMTAVSLLFAIYMVKPSPFCVLDELDAPLDDANIGRYTDMLKEFTRYSQFLVITHSKRTVSAADTIYGVTMQERGVTKLVSMRFTDFQ